jgi:hypothetical protein
MDKKNLPQKEEKAAPHEKLEVLKEENAAPEAFYGFDPHSAKSPPLK